MNQTTIESIVREMANTYYPSGQPENYLKPKAVEDLRRLLTTYNQSILERLEGAKVPTDESMSPEFQAVIAERIYYNRGLTQAISIIKSHS